MKAVTRKQAMFRQTMIGVAFLAFAALAMVAVLASAGCAAPVGRTLEQDATGQKSTNSPRSAVTFTQQPASPQPGDYINTATFDADHGIRETIMDADGIEARGSGEVRTDLMFRVIDGVPVLSAISGKDTTMGKLTVETKAGDTMKVTIDGVTAKSSDPIRAANEALDRYKDIMRQLSADQRAVIESANAAWAESVQKVAAEIVPLAKVFMGVPPL